MWALEDGTGRYAIGGRDFDGALIVPYEEVWRAAHQLYDELFRPRRPKDTHRNR